MTSRWSISVSACATPAQFSTPLNWFSFCNKRVLYPFYSLGLTKPTATLKKTSPSNSHPELCDTKKKKKSCKIGCYLSSLSEWHSIEEMKRRDLRCVGGVEHGGHLDQSTERFTTSTWNWMFQLISTPCLLLLLPSALPLVLNLPRHHPHHHSFPPCARI